MSADRQSASPDWKAIRAHFPVLARRVHDKRLAYLDSAASSQMPRPVLDRIVEYQTTFHSNIHRGVHALSQEATDAFEGARESVARHLNAAEPRQCIVTRGATEAINLVMHGWGRKFVGEGDEIIVSSLEHHSNIVPWQMLCEEKGARLRVIPMSDEGILDIEAFKGLFNDRTKLVGLIHVSNALGTINDVKRFVEIAHEHGVPVLVDGCQAVPHMEVDVQDLDVDFYAFSGHKMCGPTGVGGLYGKVEHLEAMGPFMGGGDMILSVTFEKSTYNTIPHKFEAGTPPIMAFIGLGAAIEYSREIGLDAIAAREHQLLEYATAKIREIEGVRILGPQDLTQKTAVLSMVVDGVHPHDIGTILDAEGVAIRAGHHCAQPLMQRLGVAATARASLAFYNDEADVDQLVAALQCVHEIFG